VIQKRPTVLDHLEEDALDRFLSQRKVAMKLADELSAESPRVVDVFLDRVRRQIRSCQMFEEWPEQGDQLFAALVVVFLGAAGMYNFEGVVPGRSRRPIISRLAPRPRPMWRAVDPCTFFAATFQQNFDRFV
jgi:hypothetical protein